MKYNFNNLRKYERGDAKAIGGALVVAALGLALWVRGLAVFRDYQVQEENIHKVTQTQPDTYSRTQSSQLENIQADTDSIRR